MRSKRTRPVRKSLASWHTLAQKDDANYEWNLRQLKHLESFVSLCSPRIIIRSSSFCEMLRCHPLNQESILVLSVHTCQFWNLIRAGGVVALFFIYHDSEKLRMCDAWNIVAKNDGMRHVFCWPFSGVGTGPIRSPKETTNNAHRQAMLNTSHGKVFHVIHCNTYIYIYIYNLESCVIIHTASC